MSDAETEWREACSDLQRARATLEIAQDTERLTTTQFTNGQATFEDLREAIRHTALAEKYVTDWASVEVNLRRIAEGRSRTSSASATRRSPLTPGGELEFRHRQGRKNVVP